MTPRATLRLQLHRGFTFDDAASHLGYFAALGISHLYLSPIMTARPGSLHGYDVIDPAQVNPELGGEDALRRLARGARDHALGLIVDIVPNHMAIGSNNPWWMDVLAHGRASRFAKYFDIDFATDDPLLRDKVALPILSRPYGEALSAGEITLEADESGRTYVRHFEHRLPLAPENATREGIDCRCFDPASTEGRARLNKLLERQHYRLMWWRSANDQINWRRFFDINELAAVRVEDSEVFDAVHATVLRLYGQGLIDGVRVDHVDGLLRPGEYCRRLRRCLQERERERPADSAAGPAYLVVEKILARDEKLPRCWQTDGTTGYDFMDQVSALQHNAKGEPALTAFWASVSGRPGDFAREAEQARRQVLQRSFAAQQAGVVRSLVEIARADPATRDFSPAAVRRCVTEILAHFPVYRTYTQVGASSAADAAFLASAIAGAKATCLLTDQWLIDVLGKWLAGKPIRPELDRLQTIALGRFQQLSAPLCAKAIEDTAFYRYGRLLSRNDVGFDAAQLACSADEFHRRMQARAAEFPNAMLATASHDHKRGEDVRARLAVLSDLATEWSGLVERWLQLALPYCSERDGVRMPCKGDLAILFQMIVGAWPMTLELGDREGTDAFIDRLVAWQLKALREAKLFSDWAAPNPAYEDAAENFIRQLFRQESELLREIATFADRIAPAGAANSLAQLLIKLTAPGVPDIYQGTEYWDLSLVDPDNRSPVDYTARSNALAGSFPEDLASTWRDGRIKQSILALGLSLRREHPELFFRGRYVPLEMSGSGASHVIAYARTFDDKAVIVAAARCSAAGVPVRPERGFFTPTEHWGTTKVSLSPELRRAKYRSVLHPSRHFAADSVIEADEVFGGLPVALLLKEQNA